MEHDKKLKINLITPPDKLDNYNLTFTLVYPTDDTKSQLQNLIENFDKEKKQTEKMMKIYSEQKVDKLIPLIQKQSPEFMEFADLFLYDRNKRWIPKLIAEMQKKKSFVAVGAGHLFGEQGIIDLLKKEGYEITAINMNPVE